MWKSIALILLCLGMGCHPLQCYNPKDLDPEHLIDIDASYEAYPSHNVEIVIDRWGIPHILADNKNDVVYGMGYMHGRDRLWQMTLMRAFAQGRLTELVGEDAFELDQENRLITFNLDKEVEQMAPQDVELAASYIAGVNAAATQYDLPAEYAILGISFQPFTLRDVMSIARLQAWNLDTGFDEEMARQTVTDFFFRDDPRIDELLQPVSTRGVPVLTTAGETPTLFGSRRLPQYDTFEAGRAYRSNHQMTERKRPQRRSWLADLSKRFGRGGASNVWMISGEHTASGNALISHDPHLGHSAPGLFYMVRLEARDGTFVAGGSVPGIPAIIIGHGRDIAWGLPVSNADTMDLVRIAEVDDDHYEVDGEVLPYQRWTQRFKMSKEDDAEIRTQEWKVTRFGPVIPDVYEDRIDNVNQPYVLMWPAFFPADQRGQLISGFWDLAAASNIDRARHALEQLYVPSQSFGLATTDGDIAYHLSGEVPVRANAASTAMPRDGRTSEAGWLGAYPMHEKPILENPPQGYIIAANQRIVEDTDPQSHMIGIEGALGYRAERIHSVIADGIRRGQKFTLEDMLTLQDDITSAEALRLSNVLSILCMDALSEESTDHERRLCERVENFDGIFDVDSLGALAFVRLERGFRRELISRVFNPDLVDQLSETKFVISSIHRLLEDEVAGAEPTVFDNPGTPEREGAAFYMAIALRNAASDLETQLGQNDDDWTWGDAHRLSFQGALSRAPVIGGLFDLDFFPVRGCRNCVRADAGNHDSGDEVTKGAVFRIVAEMSDPPVVRMIGTTGQSGHFGDAAFDNFVERWDAVNPIEVHRPMSEIRDEQQGGFWLRKGFGL